MKICSSWNTDRVAACCITRPRKVSAQKKVVKMYTEIRGNSVAVKTYRHAVKFAHVYEAKVVSAGVMTLNILRLNTNIYSHTLRTRMLYANSMKNSQKSMLSVMKKKMLKGNIFGIR